MSSVTFLAIQKSSNKDIVLPSFRYLHCDKTAHMDLTTNGVVITYAIEFIEWSNKKLNFLQKKEEEDNEDY